MHPTPAGFVFVPGTDRVTATAVVFDVTREGDPAPYVCKRLGSRVLDEPWVRARLRAEGELLRRLGGRGAPELVAAGDDATGPWLVMKRLSGQPLARRSDPTPAWTVSAATHAFEALARLHEAGVIHADLNPDNVFVTDDASAATLLDFGLARWPGAPGMPPGPFRGTLAYTAPEVARGEPFDGRADVFALAAVLLHVASGQPPRPQQSQAAMLLAAGEADVAPWAIAATSHLPAQAGEVLARCCAFDPAGRPAAGQVVDALKQC
jgi:serine/threonine protein kinase